MIAKLDRISLGYDDTGRGNGPPLVFLHGSHITGLVVRSAHPASDSRRCISVDFVAWRGAPSHRLTRWISTQTTSRLDGQAADRPSDGVRSIDGWLHRVRDVSPSSATIRALILADTKAGVIPTKRAKKRRAMAQLARERGASAVADGLMASMVGKHTRETAPQIVDSVYRMLSSANVAGIVGALEAIRERPDSTATLSTLDVLTLIVVGEEDVLTPVAEAEAMHRAIYEAGSRSDRAQGM